MQRVQKLCNRCDKVGEHSVRPNGYTVAYCLECQRAYSKNHYAENKHKHNSRRAVNAREHRERLRAVIVELKSVPCADCGQRFHPVAMDFDHLDGSTKLLNVSEVVSRGWPLERIMDEIAKCEVVCANCHRVRTWTRAQASGAGDSDLVA